MPTDEDEQDVKQLLADLLTQKMAAKGVQDGIAELQGRFREAGFLQTDGFFERANKYMGMVQDNILQLYQGLNGIVDEKEKGNG